MCSCVKNDISKARLIMLHEVFKIWYASPDRSTRKVANGLLADFYLGRQVQSYFFLVFFLVFWVFLFFFLLGNI